MSGCGFPFLNNRECDRVKACGCGSFGGCDGGCGGGCGGDKGCDWGGRIGKCFHKGRGCQKGCEIEDEGCGFGDFGGFGGFI